jgi:2'-5' RNA ligase
LKPACETPDCHVASRRETGWPSSCPARVLVGLQAIAIAFCNWRGTRATRTSPSSSIRTVRLFLAIDPGDECRRHVSGIVESIRASTSGIRWVREGQFHLTLSFLGEVDGSRVEDISVAARDVAARHQRLSVSVVGAGVFPDWRRIRVVWLGLGDASALAKLGKDMGDTVTALGFPQRPFRAHLTIGRTTGPLSAEQKTRLSRAVAEHNADSCSFDVTRVVLMRSTLGRAGSVYSEIESFPLGGA